METIMPDPIILMKELKDLSERILKLKVVVEASDFDLKEEAAEFLTEGAERLQDAKDAIMPDGMGEDSDLA